MSPAALGACCVVKNWAGQDNSFDRPPTRERGLPCACCDLIAAKRYPLRLVGEYGDRTEDVAMRTIEVAACPHSVVRLKGDIDEGLPKWDRRKGLRYQIGMHELSLAQSIIEIAAAAAKQHNAAAIRTVKLRLGEFTGVVRDALEFGFEIARRGTTAETAVLEIEGVPLKTLCPQCGTIGRPNGDFCLICEECASPLEIVSGREMEVEYVDLVEASDAGGCGGYTGSWRCQGRAGQKNGGS
jgi:hydrogenase nickel incorporation protein HypA/HybF